MKLQPDRFALPFCHALPSQPDRRSRAGPVRRPRFRRRSLRREGHPGRRHPAYRSRHRVQLPAGARGRDLRRRQEHAAIKALYATGFFKDIRLEEENGVLVVLVEERPAIATVDFTGTKEFEKDMLVKALKDIGVGETKIYDKASVDRAEQELKRQYLSHGLYGVKITTTVTPIERNRVNVMFNVDEGDIAKHQGHQHRRQQGLLGQGTARSAAAEHLGLVHLVLEGRPVLEDRS
jgi:hypothetical protein